MLSKQIVKLINDQINKEFYSAYFYLDIANYYMDKNLEGFANWFNVQAQEEQAHAMLFLSYLQNNGEQVVLQDIKCNHKLFTDYKEPLIETLRHEQTVTASIHTIYATAFENKEFRTTQFLEWFIKEQGEEEKNAEDLIKKYELFGQDGKGLYFLNQELATRVYVPPTLVL